MIIAGHSESNTLMRRQVIINKHKNTKSCSRTKQLIVEEIYRIHTEDARPYSSKIFPQDI